MVEVSSDGLIDSLAQVIQVKLSVWLDLTYNNQSPDFKDGEIELDNV